jgi:hypothetical protein
MFKKTLRIIQYHFRNQIRKVKEDFADLSYSIELHTNVYFINNISR